MMMVSGNAIGLVPGEESDAIASGPGGDKNLFLMVYIRHATLSGSYEVRIEIE
jgi:hypothetical protein